jgi:hypothetical protein
MKFSFQKNPAVVQFPRPETDFLSLKPCGGHSNGDKTFLCRAEGFGGLRAEEKKKIALFFLFLRPQASLLIPPQAVIVCLPDY